VEKDKPRYYHLMKNFSTDYFFSFQKSCYRDLFEKSPYPWDLLKNLFSYVKKTNWKIEVELPDTAFFKNIENISIGKGTIIEPGAYIQGPAIIGPQNIIRSGAYIREFVITGLGCLIGHGTEINRSILLDNVKMAHFNFVGDSVLGNGVNLGAGAKLANVRLDKKEISVFLDQEKKKTGLFKFGAILGDGVQIGCNCVTNPGTIVVPYNFCFPCCNVGGFINLKK
jgi:UDP-N-acetylglucosamine diphosphorylase / glucose-1-phosphate thymidylyltransferase / UDP-N-acetylgalactosamine diphosphorylase / glucosamine-1-phosphate N-acetyltransferase / galactosamine-1-phosphate N-acetyltransferase